MKKNIEKYITYYNLSEEKKEFLEEIEDGYTNEKLRLIAKVLEKYEISQIQPVLDPDYNTAKIKAVYYGYMKGVTADNSPWVYKDIEKKNSVQLKDEIDAEKYRKKYYPEKSPIEYSFDKNFDFNYDEYLIEARKHNTSPDKLLNMMLKSDKYKDSNNYNINELRRIIMLNPSFTFEYKLKYEAKNLNPEKSEFVQDFFKKNNKAVDKRYSPTMIIHFLEKYEISQIESFIRPEYDYNDYMLRAIEVCMDNEITSQNYPELYKDIDKIQAYDFIERIEELPVNEKLKESLKNIKEESINERISIDYYETRKSADNISKRKTFDFVVSCIKIKDLNRDPWANADVEEKCSFIKKYKKEIIKFSYRDTGDRIEKEFGVPINFIKPTRISIVHTPKNNPFHDVSVEVFYELKELKKDRRDSLDELRCKKVHEPAGSMKDNIMKDFKIPRGNSRQFNSRDESAFIY